MNVDIDVAIVIGFLLLNLGVGLYYGRGVKNLQDYALGGRNFNTATLTATIVATWISGSFFAITISEAYKEGVWFVIAGSGDILSLLITAFILGPKIGQFFGNLSVAETMGDLFGKYARIITALASIIKTIGYTAVQIKIFSMLFSHFLGINDIATTLISTAIVITYSAFGGVKSVTFTDVIQFITFGVFIPICALFIWKLFGNETLVKGAIEQSTNFDYTQLTNTSNPKFWTYLFLFFYFAVPQLNPTMFQRMLMGKNTDQVKHSFAIAACIILTIHFISCFIGLTIYSYDSTLDTNNILLSIYR